MKKKNRNKNKRIVRKLCNWLNVQQFKSMNKKMHLNAGQCTVNTNLWMEQNKAGFTIHCYVFLCA